MDAQNGPIHQKDKRGPLWMASALSPRLSRERTAERKVLSRSNNDRKLAVCGSNRAGWSAIAAACFLPGRRREAETRLEDECESAFLRLETVTECGVRPLGARFKRSLCLGNPDDDFDGLTGCRAPSVWSGSFTVGQLRFFCLRSLFGVFVWVFVIIF